jgi:hypothetical protein
MMSQELQRMAAALDNIWSNAQNIKQKKNLEGLQNFSSSQEFIAARWWWFCTHLINAQLIIPSRHNCSDNLRLIIQ